MWRPETWADLESLLGQAEETSTLDFKGEFGSTKEMAKDIAAMTVNGGTILYGVAENRETRVATELQPQALKGAEERIHQVVGTRISPSPGIEIICVSSPTSAAEGIVAVVVAPSLAAPHQVTGRYPARRGTTTEYLEEAEVERLYRARQEAQWSSPHESSTRFRQPPQRGSEAFPLDAGVGVLEIVVSCLAGRHPHSPWLRDPLDEMVTGAENRLNALISARPRFFAGLKGGWNSLDTVGWYSGRGQFDNETLSLQPRSAAVLTYPCDWSFWISFPLGVRDGDGQILYSCARESWVVSEATAAIALAGEFMAAVPAAGILSCSLVLGGFDNALPQWRTNCTAAAFGDDVARVPPRFAGATYASAVSLRDAPQEVVRTLIDPWLAAFYQGRDLINGLLLSPTQES
jgi:Putative DNA-binding domain